MAAGAKINATLRMHTACTLYAFTPRAPSNRVRSSFFYTMNFIQIERKMEARKYRN